jgi:hypothetical protein
MAEQKNPCGCGCLPEQLKGVKMSVPTKTVKKAKRVLKKSK